MPTYAIGGYKNRMPSLGRMADTGIDRAKMLYMKNHKADRQYFENVYNKYEAPFQQYLEDIYNAVSPSLSVDTFFKLVAVK